MAKKPSFHPDEKIEKNDAPWEVMIFRLPLPSRYLCTLPGATLQAVTLRFSRHRDAEFVALILGCGFFSSDDLVLLVTSSSFKMRCL